LLRAGFDAESGTINKSGFPLPAFAGTSLSVRCGTKAGAGMTNHHACKKSVDAAPDDARAYPHLSLDKAIGYLTKTSRYTRIVFEKEV